jgi:hypothetical protein
MFNDEHSMEYRELVLHVIAALEEKKRRVQETIRKIDQLLASHPEQAEQLAEERSSAEEDMAKLDHQLSRVAGVASS